MIGAELLRFGTVVGQFFGTHHGSSKTSSPTWRKKNNEILAFSENGQYYSTRTRVKIIAETQKKLSRVIMGFKLVTIIVTQTFKVFFYLFCSHE